MLIDNPAAALVLVSENINWLSGYLLAIVFGHAAYFLGSLAPLTDQSTDPRYPDGSLSPSFPQRRY
jgi:hypothetical protein